MYLQVNRNTFMLSAYRVKLRSTLQQHHLLHSPRVFCKVIFEVLEQGLHFPTEDEINRGINEVSLLFSPKVYLY